MAGTIQYLAPVDNASGKIFGKIQKFIAVTRLTGKRQRGCAVTGVRTTKPSDTELAHRDKFAAVAAATAARMKDPGKINADQLAYQELKSQYPSLRAYVWNQEWSAYEG